MTDGKNTATEIARRLGRSRKAVTNYQRALSFCRPLTKLGLSRKISSKVTRAFVCKARTGEYSARDLQQM